MITAELNHVTTLQEFNSEIRRIQEEAHGKNYCAMNDAITKYLKECDSYMELGTHQGGSASTAMLTNTKSIQLVDIDFSLYNESLKPIASKYCKENDIELSLKEVDSRIFSSVKEVDMLVIDTVHKPEFMQQELDLHGSNVNKYIIAHDTSARLRGSVDLLYNVLAAFAKRNRWEILERYTENVGYTVLKKK
ncbi:MAG: hypothetical protein CBC55_09005 [Gammaproteobacteria bacterium TMED95]|nr:MAG: hypothetical protein CBC55_09005 [Gammaproteobacteria bacterium TMED95]|tara:strand:+ start:831 stop:1406 length:576 start_codon:yes stop_codon:yes gene_type:complete